MRETTHGDGFAGDAESTRNRSRQLSECFVGQSSLFRSLINKMKTVAPRQCPVIIIGETGTGKEMVARQIHAYSRRAEYVFMPVDCTALTGQLFESQLFGHLKGSFTGAAHDTLGFFRAADGGTIFLDEIEELSLGLQAKLLRVLQESGVTPVGSTKSYAVNVRVICAANRNLQKMVREGTFRTDLYFRLNVVTLEVPPLRERKEDIVILAEYFLNKQARLYNEPTKTLLPSAVKALTSYRWPGNVRELANVMERAFVMSPSNQIGASELPTEIFCTDILPPQEHSFPTLDEVTKRLVLRALETAMGHKMAAARLLSIDHRRLNRLIAKFELWPSYK